MSRQERYAGALMNTFGPPELALVRGEGAHVWDADGNEYVDLLGGIAVNALGHAHPALVEAVTTQLQTLGHVSNFFATEPQVALAERLLELLGWRRRRRSSSPTPAPRPTRPRFKLTRRTGRTHVVRHRGQLPRPHHGRARAHLQGGLPRAVRAAAGRGHLRAVRRRRRARRRRHRRDRRRRPRADPGRGRRASSRRRATSPPPARSPREHGALLWLDEVQTGIGRTGAWFAHQLPSPGRRRPTSSPWPRASAAASRSAPPSRRGAAGDAARARQPRHHLRRQPGRLRGRARRPRHHRVATACSTHVAHRRRAPRDAASPTTPGHRGPRRTACCSALDLTGPTPPPWSTPPATPASSSTPPARRGCGFAPPLVLTEADVDAFARRLAGDPRRRPRRPGVTRDPPLPARRRPHPGRAGRGPRLAAALKADPFDHTPARRAADRRAGLRQADAAHPGLVRRRHRRARRPPDDRRRRPGRDRRSASRSRTSPGCSGRQAAADRLADRRAGATSRRWPSTPASRSSTRSPTSSTPASCSPTCSDRPGAQRARLAGAARRLRRRRRQQHGQLLAARRRHRGHARRGRRPRRLPARRRRRARAQAIARETGGSVDARRRPGRGGDRRRRRGHRHLGLDGQGGRRPTERRAPSAPYAAHRRAARPRRPGRDRAALPAGLPRQGDRRRGHRRPAERRLGRGREPAARAEGAADLAAGARMDERR